MPVIPAQAGIQCLSVIPAQAGIQFFVTKVRDKKLDARLRGHDG
jgi:hypothetical protein